LAIQVVAMGLARETVSPAIEEERPESLMVSPRSLAMGLHFQEDYSQTALITFASAKLRG